MTDLRILIVGDNPLARMGLAALLATQEGCQVVGQIAADDDLPTLLDVYRPGVVVWDMGWEIGGAFDMLADVRDIPIAILVSREAPIAAALNAGAKAILPQEVKAEQLVAALHAIDRDLLVIDPIFAESLTTPHPEPPLPPVTDLTPRELEVLQLLAEGFANKAIAQQLHISDHTVKFHVNSIMTKLGAQSRTEAVVRATRLGLILL